MMTSQDEKLNRGKLCLKIEKIANEIGALPQDGTNKFSNYSYISNEQMMTAIRSKLLENKVSILPEILKVEEKDFQAADEKTGKVKVTIRTRVLMRFEIIDCETGYSLFKRFSGSEQDTGGKSEQQAVTQCMKYFMFKLLKVTSKEETDSDSQTNEVNKPKANTTNTQKQSYEGKEDDRPWLTEEQLKSMITYLKDDSKEPDENKRKATIKKKMLTYKMKKEFKAQLETAIA